MGHELLFVAGTWSPARGVVPKGDDEALTDAIHDAAAVGARWRLLAAAVAVAAEGCRGAGYDVVPLGVTPELPAAE